MMILTILQLGVLHTATVVVRAPKAKRNAAALIGGRELVLVSVVKTMKRLATMKIMPLRSASPLLKEDVTALKKKLSAMHTLNITLQGYASMCAALMNKKCVMTMILVPKHVLILQLVAVLVPKEKRNVEPSMDTQVIAPLPTYAVLTMKNSVTLMTGTDNQRVVL
jgi:hypothetical protein